jgi:hypothetical protein
MLQRIGVLAVALGAGALVALAMSCSEDQNLVQDDATGGSPSTGGAGVGGGAVECIDGLTAITLDPDGSMLTLDGSSTPQSITFTATGTLSDGTSMPIAPQKLLWSAARADDTEPGTIAAGVFTPYPYAGGVVTITATDGCIQDTTTVKLFLDVEIGQPADPADWTGPVSTEGSVPVIVYPSHETVFPRNLYRTLFQWRSQGFTEFRLLYEGPSSSVTVYTDGVHGLCSGANPAAGCWEVNELAWTFIAGSNAGESATWTVQALDPTTDPPTIREGAPIDIGFSLQDVEGAIFYWSTTSAGIRRGRISQQDPDDYIVGKPVATTYGDNAIKCVACHVVSRDGQYLAAPTDSEDSKSLWIWQVTQDPPPTPLVTTVPETAGHGFATISPDNARVVAAFKGNMWMLDRATGDNLGDLPLAGMIDKGTHPDWSPLGGELVFATGDGDAPGNASLARIPYQNGQWGSPAVFLSPPVGRTNLFPMFSPGGEWIAFSQGKGGHGDVEAQLHVIASQATSSIELVKANRITSNQTTDGQYQNSQPTWAPPGDYHWIAFNSKREYGVVRPGGTQQIWIAAVDPDKIALGQDPSFPAFRVPFQGLDENNHRAYWTLDIGTPDGGGGMGGGGGGGPGCSDILGIGEACDPVNDCCEAGSYCDTLDSGVTYVCVQIVPQ